MDSVNALPASIDRGTTIYTGALRGSSNKGIANQAGRKNSFFASEMVNPINPMTARTWTNCSPVNSKRKSKKRRTKGLSASTLAAPGAANSGPRPYRLTTVPHQGLVNTRIPIATIAEWIDPFSERFRNK